MNINKIKLEESTYGSLCRCVRSMYSFTKEKNVIEFYSDIY